MGNYKKGNIVKRFLIPITIMGILKVRTVLIMLNLDSDMHTPLKRNLSA